MNFREKGANSRIGGYFWVATEDERDALTEYLKSLDARVEWEEA